LLRTIGNNIANAAQSADTLEISVQGVTKQIDLLDSTTGDMRSTFDIMQDIFTNGWEDMSNAEKQALAISLAGKNQFEVFVSVLENFADAQKAVVLATNSAGSAEKENEAYLDSLGAKLNQTKALLQELVLGDGGLEKFGKTLLNVGIAILKFANSDIGQAIIKITLMTTAITVAGKAFQLLSKTSVISWLSNIGTAFGMLATEIATTGNVVTAFNLTLETLNINPVVLGITAIVAAGYGLYKLVGYLNPSLEKLNENVKNANSEYKQTTGNIDSIKETLKTINSQIDSIRSKDKIELTDQKQLEMLQKEQASLEQQLLLQEELQRSQRDEATKAGEKVLSKDVYDAGAFGVDMGTGEVQTGTSSEALVSYTNQINELQQQLEPLLQQKQALEDANKQESQEYAELRGRIVDLTEQQDSARSAAVDYAKTIEEATENADDSNDKIKEGIDALDGYYDALKNVDGKSQDTSDNIGNLGDKTEESNEDLEESASKAEQLASEWEAWNSSIDSIQSAYDTLSSAVEEYNTQGGYSIDTLQALLALDPAYLSALQEENGQMTLNIDVIKQKIQAEADEAKQLIYKTTIQKLNALASDTASEATTNAGNASANAVDQHNANAQAIGGEAKASMVLAAANSAIGKGASKVDVNKVLREMNQQLKAVDSWVDSVGKNFSRSMGTATKSTNRATNAVNKQSQALQNAKKALQSERDAKVKEIEAELKALEKQYKAEKDAIEKERDDRIDAIEKERDTQIDAIEAEIDAVEKEQKARKEYWDQQLANLEAQNQVVEDGIELQQLYNDLATAQQTKKMIFKDGRFVYSSDEASISTAQSAIDEFNRKKEYEEQKAYLESLRDMEDKNYEDRLDDLQSFKEQRTKYYEELLDQLKDYYEESLEQLKNHYEEEKSRLEDYRDQIKESYDKQIDDLENHKNSLNSKYNQMLRNQNAYQNNSLASAQAYVNKYNAIMRGLANGGVTTVSTSEGIKVGGKTSSTTIGEALKGGSARWRSNAKSTGDNYVNGYASGVNGVNDSELSVVGENPKYREIVIGSKLNNDQGAVMALKRGSGVVNAKATNTLASLFNAFTSQRSVGQAISSDNHATTIEIGSISLPQVTDGKSFISYLQNFKTDLAQRAFKR
jgi:ABC-type transporter Mla subunit MlaD